MVSTPLSKDLSSRISVIARDEVRGYGHLGEEREITDEKVHITC